MRKKLFLLATIVGGEVIFLTILIPQLIQRQQYIARHDNLTPIHKDNLVFNSSELKYYYDLKPNSTQIWTNDRLSNIVTTYRINSDGLNEEKDYTITKPQKTFRIIILGDSNTFGLYVKPSDNFSSILEKKLNKSFTCSSYSSYDVINFGVPGYDPSYAVEKYRLKGMKYDPDLIIWNVSTEDLNEILEKIIPLMEKYSSDSGRLHAKEELLDSFSKESILNYQKRVFQTFSDLYQGPLVVFSPTQYQADDIEFLENSFLSRQPHYLLRFERDLSQENALIKNDSHPNAKGHTIIADFLLRELERYRLLPCPSK